MSEHKITLPEVRRVASLARLAMSDEQLASMQSDMDAILGYMAELDELDVSTVQPTFHAVPIALPLRADAVTRSLPIGEALSQAPEVEASGFAVPKVMEGGE